LYNPIMNTVILRLLVIGLSASISPVAIMVLISVMSKKNPRRNSLLFLLGYASALVALGILAVCIFFIAGSGGPSKVDGYIDLSLGALCFLSVPFGLRKKDKKGTPRVERGSTAFRSFSLGSTGLFINPSTYLVFISGLHVISSAHLGWRDDFLSLAFLTLVTLVTLLVPIIIFLAFPKRFEKVLGSLNAWLSKYGGIIQTAILLIFGVHLLTKGLRILL